MQSKPLALAILDVITLIVLAIAAYLALVFAPTEVVMGQVQRVFYFHVGTAWVGLLGFLFAAVSGIVYLIIKDARWDRVEVAAVEVSTVFFFITIVLGSIWARPVWNTWWTWDPRLVTATVMELIYVAYVMLRQGIEDPDRRARFGSVYGIIGFLSVPVTFLSIRLFRTIHPVVIGSGDPTAEGTFDMTPRMLQAFMFSLLTFTVLYVTLLWHRLRLQSLTDRVEQLKMRLMAQ
jgi:heme exporter protein C